jgi:hypothetical protein
MSRCIHVGIGEIYVRPESAFGFEPRANDVISSRLVLPRNDFPVLYPLNRVISALWRNNCDTLRYTSPSHAPAWQATRHPATFSSERDGICQLAQCLYRANNVIGWAMKWLPIGLNADRRGLDFWTIHQESK